LTLTRDDRTWGIGMSSQMAEAVPQRLRVIEPKLMPPRVHPGMLRRARLLDALDGAREVPLTILSAGVGYGKTTLARSWCTERPEAVIWLTLDAADDDPVRLWTHLAAGVDRLGEGLGSRALACLATPGAAIETAVDELMNGIVAFRRRATIVLDDLHLIRSDACLRSIGHAVDRLPANARVVASTRSNPRIGLARMRARRALAELRARELAFTVEETRELLVREGIDLSGEGVELLAERTEGWPAGLYLAALWLRDLDDPERGVREFAGTARQVGDYLTEEVLAALEPATRDFLLRTSVLGRFTPELCDAVLGREDSRAVLAELARLNMFLVALDARGGWYRYHHLFGEVLQLELGRDAALELRRRAAAWCRGRGLVEDAIEYAALAGDAAMVAGLLLEYHREFVWGGRLAQLLGWIRWLPPEVLAEHPLLPVAGAQSAALLARPEVEIQQLLAIAERAHRNHPEQWSPYLEAAAEVTRAAVIQGGDVGEAVERGRRAVEAARLVGDVLMVGALATLAQALFFAGELEETRQIALEVVERPDATQRPIGYLASLGLLASVDAEHGRAESAESWALQALSFARERFQAGSWVASFAHLGLALACVAMGRFDEAEREAACGERLRRSLQPTVGHAHALLILAQVRIARSRLARAESDVAQAQRAIAEFPDPGRLPAIAATIEQDLVTARAPTGSRHLIEHPSPAELAVLRGLAAGLSRREIGTELYISLNTVKTHTRELYRKLGVSSQAQAVTRAEALGLLEKDQSPG
jgi:LuxR family transcriptional regulator, maltose regulon positive regulatory protein